jgi:hypothetical protein
VRRVPPQEVAAQLQAGDVKNPVTKDALERLGIQDLHEDFGPPSKAAKHGQRLADQGKRGFAYFPSDSIDSWYAPYFARVTTKDGQNHYGTIFAFVACFFRWGLTSLLLEKAADGSGFWTLGQFLTYFFLLMQIGHIANYDRELHEHNIPAIALVIGYDQALREYFHDMTSRKKSFNIANQLEKKDMKIYDAVKRELIAKKRDRARSDREHENYHKRGSEKANLRERDQKRLRPEPHSVPFPCKFIQNGESCKYGAKCKFQHEGVAVVKK